jgi:hypothetical protein
VKGLSEVTHRVGREQVNGDGEPAYKTEGDEKGGFECHRRPRVSTLA